MKKSEAIKHDGEIITQASKFLTEVYDTIERMVADLEKILSETSLPMKCMGDILYAPRFLKTTDDYTCIYTPANDSGDEKRNQQVYFIYQIIFKDGWLAQKMEREISEPELWLSLYVTESLKTFNKSDISSWISDTDDTGKEKPSEFNKIYDYDWTDDEHVLLQMELDKWAWLNKVV